MYTCIVHSAIITVNDIEMVVYNHKDRRLHWVINMKFITFTQTHCAIKVMVVYMYIY